MNSVFEIATAQQKEKSPHTPLKEKNNPNVNVITSYRDKKNRVNRIAERLCEVLSDDESLNFFRKVAWRLPEHAIWSALEQAKDKRKPAAYFTAICLSELID